MLADASEYAALSASRASQLFTAWSNTDLVEITDTNSPTYQYIASGVNQLVSSSAKGLANAADLIGSGATNFANAADLIGSTASVVANNFNNAANTYKGKDVLPPSKVQTFRNYMDIISILPGTSLPGQTTTFTYSNPTWYNLINPHKLENLPKSKQEFDSRQSKRSDGTVQGVQYELLYERLAKGGGLEA
jgi:hypothetical protein